MSEPIMIDIPGDTLIAIQEALKRGKRVELLRDKDGNIIAQEIQRKRLKIE